MERHSLDSSSRAAPSKKPRKTRSRSQSLAALPNDNPQSEPPYQIPAAPPPILRKIPRPPNAFILYRSSKMRELISQESQSQTTSGLSKLDYQRQLSKRIGELWRNEEADVKAAFYEKSQQAAREHAERYPEYKYKPKPLPKKEQEVSPSRVQDKTPERKGDTDFAPGNLSGPISGSGSGSGRKRASLEGARAKASPYTAASRHRRTSSGGPTSPSIRQTSNSQVGQTLPVLLYAASDTHSHHNGTAHVQRSVSQKCTHERKAKVAARRSLDGHAVQASTSNDPFNTLVPQHLRDPSHIFLAPAELPPLPIGQAITTDDRAPSNDAIQQSRPQRPKMNLAQAVKKALPPERRALLHASLVRRGLVPTTEVPLSQSQNFSETAAPNPNLPQSDSYSTLDPSSSQSSFLPIQESTSTLASYPESQPNPQPQLSPELDPANQASLNISMSATQAQRYGVLSDWTQPDPCWLEHSCSQATDVSHTSSAQGLTQSDYTELSQTLVETQQSYADPVNSFGSFEMGSYTHSALNYPVTAVNSAVLALSDPNDAGQIQGHLFGLDGEFIAQGTTVGEVGLYMEEEERQQRAVQELLLQMTKSSAPGGGGTVTGEDIGCPVHLNFNDTVQHGHVQEQSQWQQTWQSGTYEDQLYSQEYMAPNGAVTYSDYPQQPDYSNINPTFDSNSTFAQDWTDSQANGQFVSPTPTGPNFNFSRPLGYEVPSQQPGEHLFGAGEAIGGFAEGLSLDAAGLVTSDHDVYVPQMQLCEQSEREEREAREQDRQVQQAESQSRGTKGLRSWKAQQLSTIKEKFARIKHRHSPSNTQVVREEGENGPRVKRER